LRFSVDRQAWRARAEAAPRKQQLFAPDLHILWIEQWAKRRLASRSSSRPLNELTAENGVIRFNEPADI
jgi:hypothetical protein